MQFQKGFGHGGLPDRDKVEEMYAFARDPAPLHVTWDPTDPVITHCFWLSVDKPQKGQNIDSSISANTIRVTANVPVDLDLDTRLIDPTRPLHVVLNGKDEVRTVTPSFATLCRSFVERGDPELAYSSQIKLKD
jgi:hypothetical protein